MGRKRISGQKTYQMKILSTFSDKRILFASLLLLTLAFSFWAGSRVPALNEKATMGTEIDFNNLGFNTVFSIQPGDSLVKRVAFTTVNWIDTNKKGMTFGVLFAAGIMTLLSLLKRRSFKNGFANSALGLVIGAPLGVCVNCAAPIAAGMTAAGSKIETTLATMISSPTLNVIVLTILISLFPLYLVAIKLGLTLVFILLIIPLMTRYLLKAEAKELAQEHCGIIANETCPVPNVDLSAEKTHTRIFPALKWLFVNYFKNFWFVLRMTVPLMFLAGFLGALLINILPWESIANIIPETNAFMTFLSMAVVALVGIFLPVPIAFDVIISAVLLATGMPVKYVMVLLFTLGIFSIYSYFVVSRFISTRSATIIFIILAGMGVLSGYIAHAYEKVDSLNKTDFFLSFFLNAENIDEPLYHTSKIYNIQEQGNIVEALKNNPVINETILVDKNQNMVLERSAFASTNVKADKLFNAFRGDKFGLDIPGRFSLFKMVLPFLQGHGRGVSTGDVHNDGRSDVLFRADANLMLYANNEGNSFSRQAINVNELSGFTVTNAALVDLNNDGWLDIFLSTFINGNYVIFNDQGHFRQENFSKLPNASDLGITLSAAFGDIDKDGDLDMVLGNWELGWGQGSWISSDKTHNVILLNDNGKFSVHKLPGHPGTPTSIMLSDFTGDNVLDLAVGNDFGAPDYFYVGAGDGTFRIITPEENIFPYTTHDTMSISSADINNDLVPEIYVAELSYYRDTNTFNTFSALDACKKMDPDLKKDCQKNAGVQKIFSEITQKKRPQDCELIEDETLRNECVMLFVIRLPATNGGYASRETCDLLPESWKTARHRCQSNLNNAVVVSEQEKSQLISQKTGNNILFVATGEGKYTDKAKEYGLQHGGWAWNSKFADLNNDEWQDLYIANGTLFSQNKRESNYYLENKAGKTFVNLTDISGLASWRVTSSFSYIDIDNDGDIDIITVPQIGPAQVFINNTNNSANSIALSLRDHMGNRFGIGSRVIIYYGENESRHQMREVKASGGFSSFDDPTVYFGLGAYTQISRIDILWPTGKKTSIKARLNTGSKYTVTRKRNIKQVASGTD